MTQAPLSTTELEEHVRGAVEDFLLECVYVDCSHWSDTPQDAATAVGLHDRLLRLVELGVRATSGIEALKGMKVG